MLTSNPWFARKAYFDSVTLRVDGDDTEKFGAIQHDLDNKFANYEQFWRYHVVPATQRPNNREFFNQGASAIAIRLAQRSWTVFTHLVESYEYLTELRVDGAGPRFRNWYNTVTYAGNAMQMFHALRGTVDGLLSQIQKSRVEAFSDWKDNWQPRFEKAAQFRDCVTHDGRFQIFTENGQNFVRRISRKRGQPTDTWSDSVWDYLSDKSHFETLPEVAASIVETTTEFLNDAYGVINVAMAPLTLLTEYQSHWGWPPAYSGQIGLPATPPTVCETPGWGSGNPVINLSLFNTTASSSDSRRTKLH